MKRGSMWMGLVLGAALSVTALHAQDVKTDYSHKADFASYHTFSFGRVQTSDPLYEQRVRRDVTQQLTSKGWQKVPSGGDVTVTAIGNTKTKQEYDSFYNGLGGDGFGWGGWGGGWGMGGWGGGMGDTTTTVNNIPVGTLLIDLYDNHTKQLIYRGREEGSVSNNQKKDTKNLEKAIDKMFKDFPPKSKS